MPTNIQRDHGDEGAHPDSPEFLIAYNFSGFKSDRRHRRWARPLVKRLAGARANRKGGAVRFAARGQGRRWRGIAATYTAGRDFFKDKLPVCDAYLLMEVIHDWSDAESVSILKPSKTPRRSGTPSSW